MARKPWVLDTDTKGTGAEMVPLEKTLDRPDDAARGRHKRPPARRPRSPRAEPSPPVERTSTPLPPGHVRKKATGEIGRVRAVDPKAGTVTVHWLKHGQTSTVPLTSVSRR